MGEEITNEIAIVFGVLVACFAGPAAALFFLIRRKAKARQSRRSPIGIALLRATGHSLRERLDEAHDDLSRDRVLLMVVPLLALALFLAQSHLRGRPQMAHLAPVYALAANAFIATMLRKPLDTVVANGESLKRPTWTTKEPLGPAERQAAWLARWLSSAVGSPVSCCPWWPCPAGSWNAPGAAGCVSSAARNWPACSSRAVPKR
jgi:hypothetical protein